MSDTVNDIPVVTEEVAPPTNIEPPAGSVSTPGQFSVDDHIPAELKEAYNQIVGEEGTLEDSEEEVVKIQEPEAVDIPGGEDDEEDAPPTKIDPEEIDLSSPDAVRKFIEGETEDIVTEQDEPSEADKAFWQEEEDYKKFSEGLAQLGYDEGSLDTFIRKVADKHILDNGKIAQEQQKQIDAKDSRLEILEAENERLLAVERAANFDSSSDTQEKYTGPMQKEAQELSQLLERESLNATLAQVLLAKDITEVTNLMGDKELEPGVRAKLHNHWRNYKELQTGYQAARESAKKDLQEATKVTIADDTVKNVFRNSLSYVIDGEKFDYLKRAIREGIEKHPQEATIIASGRDNFNNFVKALGPQALRDPSYLEHLASFFIDAAHNKARQEDYYSQQKELEQTSGLLKMSIAELKKLRTSAKGITGAKAGGVFNQSQSSNSQEQSEEEIVKEFEQLLSGEKKIGDIIPM